MVLKSFVKVNLKHDTIRMFRMFLHGKDPADLPVPAHNSLFFCEELYNL